MKKVLLWTDGWYFLQATKELSDQWNLTRIGKDPTVDVWMADVSHYVFKIFSEGKCYEQYKFSEERFIILYLRKFGSLLGVDQSTLSFYWNFLFKLLQFNPKFYLNFSIVVTIIYYHSNFSIRIWNWSPILLYTCYNLIIFNFAIMCRSQWDEINNTLNTHALGIGSTDLNPLDLLRDNTTMKDV